MDDQLDADDAVFLQVANEIRAGFKDEALWTKAFAMEAGDVSKTKATYIKLRVQKIVSQQGVKSADQESKTVLRAKPQPHSGPLQSQPKSSNKAIKIVVALAVVLIAVVALRVQEPSSGSQPGSQTPSVNPAPRAGVKPLPDDVELYIAGISVDPERPVVYISGEITKETARVFKAVIESDDFQAKLTDGSVLKVYLSSKGGDLYAAMEIGRMIRRHDLSAALIAQGADCFSSCAFIFVAGEQKIMYGRLGIHRPYKVNPSLNAAENEKSFNKVSKDAKEYLRELRVRETLFDDMVAIPPDQIAIVSNWNEARKYGILRTDPVAEEKIAAILMKKYGLDRQTYMKRNIHAHQACGEGGIEHLGRRYTFQECIDAFMQGQLELVPG